MASGWGGVLDWITGVEAPGPLTVAVHGDSDVAKQVHIMGFIPIVPAHYWVERDVTQPTHEPPLQSGPYRLTKVSRQGRYFRYSRVPDYWGRDLPINRGRFNFDTIRYERHLDAVVAREALRAGLIDVWTENDSRHWLFSYDVPALERGWLRKGTLGSGSRTWFPISPRAQHAATTVRRSPCAGSPGPRVRFRVAKPCPPRR